MVYGMSWLAWHGIWYGLVGMAWYVVWPNGHGMVYGMGKGIAWRACHSIWARSCENVSYDICEQQRCRSACASVQSDQHLCYSLLR